MIRMRRGPGAVPATGVLSLIGMLGVSPAVSAAPTAGEAVRDMEPGRADPDAAPVRHLEHLLEPIRAAHDVPALAAAIVTADHGLHAIGAAGVRARGAPERATIDDLWHIGSNTKAMTAVLCALLVEEGPLRWETTLADVLPDLAPAMDVAFRGVTVAQLCTNRGGVQSDLAADGLWRRLWTHRGTPTEARRLLAEALLRRPPEAPPGSRFVYSNAGFALAGHVCEVVTGIPWEQLIRDRLFGPLGMSTAGFGAPGTPGQPDQPRGHDRSGVPQEPGADGRAADNPPVLSPAGRVHLSLSDWATYIRLHLRGSRGVPQQVGEVVLSMETLRRLHEPADGDYAMGWTRTERAWAGPAGDRVALTHTGSNTLWYSVAWIAPARDIAVLVCCNQAERGERATDDAAWALIRDHLAQSGTTEGRAPDAVP